MSSQFARKHYLAYICVCLIWGTTWSAIRLLVRDVPPLRAAAARFFLAAMILLMVAAVRKNTFRYSARQWRALIVLGFSMMGIPYALLFWAEYRISSSMTAVLFSACPLFVALFTPLMTRSRVPRRAVFSMLIGLGAIAVLFYSGLAGSCYLLLGGAAVVAAMVLSAWSAVYAKREIESVNPLVGTAVQFCVGVGVLFAGSAILERGRPSDWNLTSLLALLFLTVFGSVIAFSFYYWLLSHMQAYQLSTTNLVVPIVATAEGALLLREAVPLLMLGAALLVLVAVAGVLRAESEGETALGLAPARESSVFQAQDSLK
jgi:drug/metabolite transporter (DMT)-like permease